MGGALDDLDIAALTRTALQLMPSAEGAPAPRSRLGGPALLPAGAEWPRDRRGRPLTFLAGLDLGELGDFDERDLLPRSGWLLTFADIANENIEGLIDESGNAEGDLARVFVVDDPVPATEPDDLLADANNVLRRRPVTTRAVPTLPAWAPDTAGVDRERFDEAFDALAEVHARGLASDDVEDLDEDELHAASAAEPYEIDDEPWTGPDDTPRTEEALVKSGWRPPDDGRSLGGVHFVGGLATGVQGHEPEDDTFLLLHLSWDEPLGFLFLDGGAIQFRIPRDAARRRDWSRVVAVADSC
ncbi:MAG TPA: DUF1963 domain-containing protein [Solirubrobacteraceae bacterium]|nr:DUF1963 domain-containing protein [Solirubrobacteraceae bacterium]